MGGIPRQPKEAADERPSVFRRDPASSHRTKCRHEAARHPSQRPPRRRHRRHLFFDRAWGLTARGGIWRGTAGAPARIAGRLADADVRPLALPVGGGTGAAARGTGRGRVDGAAWVGLTPFVMVDVRLPGVPAALPGLPTFAETNLRTYVRYRDGRDGLWFLSTEVAFPPMLAARAIGAPYTPCTLSVSTDGDTVSYSGTRGNSDA